MNRWDFTLQSVSDACLLLGQAFSDWLLCTPSCLWIVSIFTKTDAHVVLKLPTLQCWRSISCNPDLSEPWQASIQSKVFLLMIENLQLLIGSVRRTFVLGFRNYYCYIFDIQYNLIWITKSSNVITTHNREHNKYNLSCRIILVIYNKNVNFIYYLQQ